VTAEWDDGWRNARSSDPGTSHEAAAVISQAHLMIVRDHFLAWDRPQGWTYGEVWDATGRQISNPVEVRRRMSDLERDGFLCWATDVTGTIIRRTWPVTNRPQQAQRLHYGQPAAGPPQPLTDGDRTMAADELGRIARWLRRCGKDIAARHIERAIRKLGET
jgi:hypothetical protein